MNNTKDDVLIKDKGDKLHLKRDQNSLYSDIEDPWDIKEYPSNLPNDILNDFGWRDFEYLEFYVKKYLRSPKR